MEEGALNRKVDEEIIRCQVGVMSTSTHPWIKGLVSERVFTVVECKSSV